MINKMIITNSLGSNYTGEDIKLSLALLFQPWKWQRGPESETLKKVIPAKAGIYIDRFRGKPGMTVELFYKGRQAIGEALRTLKIGTDDEVIVQAFTCVAVIEPILAAGAKPVYVDVAPRSLNPLLSSIKAAVTRKTKAVILQHTLGYINTQNNEIVKWCDKNNIAVIQDLAHSLGTLILKRPSPVATGLGLKIFYILSFSQDKVVDGVSGGTFISPVIPGYDPESIKNLYRSRIKSGMTIRTLLYPLCTYLIRAT
ncbi:MAG: DegT/DnrJ/EryC1/StrS aminotransferase family protein, partial [Parcubacteria group bacterium]|nr:DegT/DnrJ/EryC1/StrS aminotransferase family protein [Parcubacteria group bacterium]